MMLVSNREYQRTESAWTKTGDDDKGAQIDMLIQRKDNVVNMCEMKFYSEDVLVDILF